jgi:uncharacterized protein YyaL (SSP411 family)
MIRPAFLRDYMNFGNNDYLTKAKAITELILMNLKRGTGFFYFTHQFHKDITVRKEVYMAMASVISIMAADLHYASFVPMK